MPSRIFLQSSFILNTIYTQLVIRLIYQCVKSNVYMIDPISFSTLKTK